MRLPTLPTTLGLLALGTASTAVLLAAPGVGVGRTSSAPVRTPQPDRVLRLGADARFPAEAVPAVAEARRADRIGSTPLRRATLTCPPGTADLGTWCLDRDVRGVGSSAEAARVCARAGGTLPSAAQLVGAAPRVRLSGRADDRAASALTDPRGADLRELSSTTFTTSTGSAAAGSPASPLPPTLQAITVFDNRDAGGFAGGVPVGARERFRCAHHPVAAGPEPRPRPALSTVTAATGRGLRATVSAPAAGRLEARATVRAGGRSVLVGVAARAVRRAGTVRLTLRPTPDGRRRLRPGRTAQVTVRVVLRLPTGVEGTASLRRGVAVR